MELITILTNLTEFCNLWQRLYTVHLLNIYKFIDDTNLIFFLSMNLPQSIV